MLVPAYGYEAGTYPSLPQYKFHESESRFRYISGGLGSGKSHGGGREFWQLWTENAEHRSNIELKLGQKLTPFNYVCAAPNYDKVATGPWATSEKYLDEIKSLNRFSLVDKTWNNTTGQKQLRMVNGDIIKFVVAPGKFAGGDAAGVWYDECDHPANTNAVGGWAMLLGRLRDYRALHRFGLASSTPRMGDIGLKAFFADKIAQRDPDYFLIECKTSDNPLHASGEYEMQLRSTMSAREADAMLDGRTVPDSGVIYGMEFDPLESMVHPLKWRKPTGRVRIAIDWGGHYHAVLIDHHGQGSTSRVDDVDIAFAEVVMDQVQDDEFISAIVRECRRWGVEPKDVDMVVCDHNPTESRIKAYKVWPGKVNSTYIADRDIKEASISTMRWRLKAAELDGDGRPYRRFLFAPSLKETTERRRLLKCMANYSRKRKIIDGEEVLLPLIAQEQIWSHGADAITYYTLFNYDHLRASDLHLAA